MSQKMKEFLASVSLVRNYITSLEKVNNKLKDLKLSGETAIGQEEVSISKKIDEEVKRGINLQNNLNTLMKNISELVKIVKEEATESEKRIVENLYSSSIKSLQNVVLTFQQIQSDIINSRKSNIIRTAEINLNRKLSEEESNKIIENPALMQDMLKSKLLSGAHQSLQNTIYDLEERHKDLLMLEHNVKEIQRMFVDLALLVSLQGEMIDNIEINVKNAKESVIHAEADLIMSKNNLSSARKKKCIILIIVVVILLVMVWPIINWTKG